MKISVRTECSPVSRPSRNGEFADSASSGGNSSRIQSQTATARSAPCTPTWTCRLQVLLRWTTQARSPLEAAVVGRVDDPLVEVVRPRVNAGRRQRQPHRLRQREQPPPPLPLHLGGLGERLASPRADLDLRGDQLTGRRLRQDIVAPAGLVEVLEAVLELERLRIDDGELLLEADGEIGGALEHLARRAEVEPARGISLSPDHGQPALPTAGAPSRRIGLEPR